MAPELSAPQGNAGGSGALREGSETLVNVRCGVLRMGDSRENEHRE